MDTKGVGKLSHILAQGRLKFTGCLLGGTHSCIGPHVRTQLPVSAGALVLPQLAHKLTGLLQRLDLALCLPL